MYWKDEKKKRPGMGHLKTILVYCCCTQTVAFAWLDQEGNLPCDSMNRPVFILVQSKECLMETISCHLGWGSMSIGKPLTAIRLGVSGYLKTQFCCISIYRTDSQKRPHTHRLIKHILSIFRNQNSIESLSSILFVFLPLFFCQSGPLFHLFSLSSNNILQGWKPWSSGYGRRLMFWRTWVWIPAPYTGWAFIHILLL